MSDLLFRRDWQVIVDTLDVSALDIEFKILRTLKPQPNQAVITVWNLNQEHRAALLKRNQPNGKLVGIPVKVDAGYIDNSSTILQCDLREVGSKREGTDWRTTICGEDGGRAWREARIKATFKKGTSVQAVIRQCAEQMGIGLGNSSPATTGAEIDGLGATLPHSITLDGSAATQLNRLMESVKLTWSIQNGVLQILPKGKPLNEQAILLTPETGLLDSPEASMDSSVSLGNPQQFAINAKPNTRKPKPKDPSIIKIKTLLIPGLVPGRKIDLESDQFSGGYYITEVLYVGQSWGPAWHCECVARVY